jgi:hypothetical protein
LCEHDRVRHALLLLPLLAALTGCGGTTATVPPATAAPPQRAGLAWEEPFPQERPRLVFGVRSFAVTEAGWEARVSVANETAVTWELGGPRLAVERQFGVMLFATGELAEVDRRNRERELPAVRSATTYRPELPLVLEPGQRWEGTIAAHGALAAGRFVRVVFGTLTAVGDPPPDLPAQVVWITDGSYELTSAR